MQCSQCLHDNPVGAKFCNECATPLALQCSACTAKNPPGAKFCNQCATPLAGQSAPQPPLQSSQTTEVESPPTEPPAPDAERRQLTVMFCDLADSTRLSGQLDPEDLRDIIRAYQAASAEVIERYDGYIAQHLGDGLMVYFGWPQAHEDDAQRAVHAGLGILTALDSLNSRLAQDKGIHLAVRIGIHTGLVVIGDIGQGVSQERLALGETPNIASRIEGIAAHDTVVISAATYQLIQSYFVCESLGQHVLKGLDDIQQLYCVLRPSGAQSRFDASVNRGLTPLVGREAEVTLLLERWAQVKDGQGQVVLLSGEAGIGKSRLVQVLKDHVANTSIRLECRSSPYYQNTALYPFTDLLQRALQWQHGEFATATLAKLEQLLSQYRLPLQETACLFAALLSLPIPENRYPPLNLSPQQRRQRTLEALVSMLLQQAEQQSVLFILEDLHWTDPSSMELLGLLFEQAPTVSLLILLTCRPAFQPPWSSRSYLTQMTLNRLSRDQIERMAERVAGGKRLPVVIHQQLVDKTDGVPLFVEEMTKTVLESGVLKEADGHYEPVASTTSLTIPATLQDSLMARLDRLVTAKAVAQYAAVIGRQFSFELLQAASQVESTVLRQELERLVEAELVYQRGLPPQATYIFKHALIQDAAYQSLLRRTRQQYHQRIARVLGNQFPAVAETQPELLAYHYTEAGCNRPAVDAWQKAGELAVERSSHVEAISHLSKGLELLTSLPETAERDQQELIMQMTLGPALMATEGYAAPEVQQTYARARALCTRVGKLPQLTSVLMGLCRFYYASGEMRTAQELGEQLLSLSQQSHDDVVISIAHTALGTILCFVGEFTRSRSHLEQSLAYALSPQEQLVQARRWSTVPRVQSLVWQAYVLQVLGYPAQSRGKGRQALTLSQQLAHPHSEVYSLFQIARIHLLRREPQIARELLEALIPLATEHTSTLWLAAGKFMQGAIHVAQEQDEESVTEMEANMSIVFASGADVFRPTLLVPLADAYGMIQQPDKGLQLLAEASAAIEKNGEHWNEAELYRIKAALLLAESLDHKAEAESCLQQAMVVARRQQAKGLELRAATSLARLWQQQGRRQDAYDLLAPIYGWFTEGFDTGDLKDANALLQELEG